MCSYKTIIDKNTGEVIEKCVLYINDHIQYFQMEENYIAVDYNSKNFIKPKWNGTEWIESATQEEIQAFKEGNDVIQKPTKQSEINCALLKENANIRLQLAEQQKINAEIIKTLAELGGK